MPNIYSRKNNHEHITRWSDSILWFVLTVVVGLSTTAYVFAYFIELDLDRVQRRLERGVKTQAVFASQLTLNTSHQQLYDVLNGLRSEIYAGAGISGELLQKWLWTPSPATLETATIEYLPRVNQANLAEFAGLMPAGESQDFMMLQETGGNFVPARPQDEYFPVLLEASSGEARAPIGLDRSNNKLIHLAMLGARDSGAITVQSSFPLAGYAEHDVKTHYFIPLYATGSTPATVAERHELLTGFIAISSYQPSADILALLSEDFQGIDSAFFPQSPELLGDPEFKKQMDSAEVVTFPYVRNSDQFLAASAASSSLAGSLATPTRWWALGIGVLITVWISSMLLWLRNQSHRIKALVIARTSALDERTRELSGANSALMESESRYRMLADNASDVIYTCDLDGNYTYISPSILQQQGFRPEELLTHPVTAHLPEESAQKIRTKLADARNYQYKSQEVADTVSKFESQTLCKDGATKWLETTVSLLTDKTGIPTDLLCVSRDITDRKKTEQEKETLEDAFRQSQKMEAIGTLAGGIAHDFNNLLTGIFGYAEILRMQLEDNPDAEESIDIIEKAATRARELTSKLLGFARKSRFQGVPVDLNETIMEVVSLLKGTIDKKIAIYTDLSAVLPVVTGDPDQLNHVLLNLGINARDAMPDGGKLVFSTSIENLEKNPALIHPDLQPGTYNVIRVTDTGSGIAKENHARIFEPFFTDKEQGKGTGLGLAMVYGVAKSHGGIVLVESALGQGSTFVLYLPYNEEVVDGLMAEKIEPPVKGSGKILVVDDEAAIRNMTESFLKTMGYSVLLAEDGMSALQTYQLNFHQIDLVIVDMVMPVMGGGECIRRLKEINPDAKIILSTGYSRETVAEQINSTELSGFLPKPYGKQQLSRAIADSLQTQTRH